MFEDEMSALRRSRQITEMLRSLSSHPGPRIRAWDGTEWGPEDATATLVLRHPGALRSMLLPPGDLSAGEAYVFDDVDIEGDVIDVMRFAADLDQVRLGPRAVALLALARSLPDTDRTGRPPRPSWRPFGTHSIARDQQVVSYHYDTGNDFFRSFLDEDMVYSCADFLDPDEDLETAQRRKLDLVCRKLDLQPGQRLLDVGCGWGALVIHAVREYGVEAVGITLSTDQAAEATDRVKAAGLDDRIEIRTQDYRNVEGPFDAIASVGMVEHVGREKLGTYFGKLELLLAPGGVVLNHGIVDGGRTHRRRRRSFIQTYVFPDGDIRPLDEVVAAARQAGLEVRDVHALRLSYALTLRHWVDRLERNADEAIRVAGEQVYRIFRAYMAGAAVAFERGHLGVAQVLLSRPDRPWTWSRAAFLAADELHVPRGAMSG